LQSFVVRWTAPKTDRCGSVLTLNTFFHGLRLRKQPLEYRLLLSLKGPEIQGFRGALMMNDGDLIF
jgi:hypothetical protein